MSKRRTSMIMCIIFILNIILIGSINIKVVAAETIKVLSPKMNVEINDNKEFSKDIYIRGWTLNNTGVKEVNIYLDGNKVSRANSGLSRPDVDKVFPGYINGKNSGFDYTLKTDNVSIGEHVISVESVGNDGQKLKKNVTIKFVGLQPKMNVELTDGQIFGNNILIRGWVLSSSDIKEVDVYSDGKILGKANYGLSRPDVNKVFPGYKAGENSGFQYNIPFDSLMEGNHTIKVVAVASDQTQMSQTSYIVLKKQKSRMNVEIDNNKVYQKNIEVRGWALNQSGVKVVNIQVDGVLNGTANYGLSRPDVNAVFPGYKSGTNSGFNYIINIDNIAPGNHTITVEVIGNDNSKMTQSVDIRVEKNNPMLNVELKEDNSYSSDIYLRGWALNNSGIKKLEVYVDDTIVGEANYGLARPDVNNLYSGYVDSLNSGFDYTLDIDKISIGKHVLLIKAIGNDETFVSQSVNVTINKLESKNFIELTDGQQVSNSILIRGWALNASGVAKVNMYIDGNQIQNIKFPIQRPDVDKAFPGYTNGVNSGFEYNLDINSITAGQHNIVIEAIGNDNGKYSKSATINVNKLEPKVFVELNDNQVVKSNVLVRGWALNASGVKNVKIYLDGNDAGQAAYGYDRPDVDAVFPGYVNGDKSGFGYTINIDSITLGKHELKVEAQGNDNSIVNKTINIVVSKDEPKMNLELNDNITFTNNVYLRGWALNDSGIKKVEVYVDGLLLGAANKDLPRSDVDKIFPGYKNGLNSGFDYTLDISSVSKGKHNLLVKSIGNDGSEISKSVYINIEKMLPKINVEINDKQVFNRDIYIRGWALNTSGIKEINIYSDGVYLGKANKDLPRPDVDKVFPGYKNGKYSGYDYTLSLDKIPYGAHNLLIQAKGNDGSLISTNVNIGIDKLKSKINVELNNNQTFNKDVFIRGWALNSSGIKEVNVYCDTVEVGNASTGLVRPDVDYVFRGYKEGVNSGFEYTLNIDSISPGVHLITVEAIGNDGGKEKVGISVNIIKKIPKVFIDSPNVNNVLTKNYNIVGWALNASGVKEIQIYLDNQLLGTTVPDILRLDVDKVFPGYKDGIFSGYSYFLDTSKFGNGQHNIKVISVGYDGTKGTADVNVNFMNNAQYYINYDRSLSDIVNIQYSQGDTAMVEVNGNWVSASKSQIEYYINPKNFMDNYGQYQFLRLNYTYGITADDLNNILVGKGVLEGKGEVFLQAAKDNDISPIYLVAHALLETGNGTSALAKGIKVSQLNKLGSGSAINVEEKTVYNMFGIGAYDSNPNVLGSEYAYKQGWFSVDAAINGGAKFISTWYINNATYKQNTLYKMRWNPDKPGSHQYATDIAWAQNQVYTIKRLMDKCKNAVLIYDIPQYK